MSSLTADTRTFGFSVEGRPIDGVVMGTGEDCYLLFGVIHGNEPIGEPVLKRLAQHLSARPELLEGKRVVLIPVLNPDGLARGTRANANGIDLNRNFPSTCFTPRRHHGSEPGSEPETQTLIRVLYEFSPRRVLSIHSPLACVNFDGPAHFLAEKLARKTGYPLRPSIGYPTPGAFGNWVGRDLKIPSITLELGSKNSPGKAWRELNRGLLTFLQLGDGALASDTTAGTAANSGSTAAK